MEKSEEQQPYPGSKAFSRGFTGIEHKPMTPGYIFCIPEKYITVIHPKDIHLPGINS
jgi:hypothetical protein